MSQFKFMSPFSIGMIFLAAISFGIVAGLRSSNTTTQAQQLIKSEIKDVRISIRDLAGNPILISSPSSVSTDVYKPSYTLTLTNTGKKSIRAYTLRTQTGIGEQGRQLEESSLSHMISENLLLLPGQSRQEINNGNGTFPEPVSQILISVDFVEFSDGTTWGEDKSKSAETLAGQRAGGAAAIAYYKHKIDSGEFDPELVESGEAEILKAVDSGKSKAWKLGFQTGIGIVRGRLSRTTGGMEAVKEELSKPFDASNGRKTQ